MMDNDRAESFAGEIRQIMEEFDLPYLKNSVENIKTPYTGSKYRL